MDFWVIVSTIIKSLSVSLSSRSFTALVNAISVIGFIVTILVYLDVSKIKRFYIFAGRAPDLAKALKHHSTTLNDCLNDFEGSQPEIQEVLARAEVTLQSISKKASGTLKRSVMQLTNDVKLYNRSTPNADKLRAIYVGMIKVNEEIADLLKDRLWEISS